MANLNNESLKKLAREQKFLGNDYLEENFQPSSYDLRIGTIFKNGKIYSTNQKNTSHVTIKPSEIVTMLTLEELNLPHTVCGTVFAKNSFSSKGILILNPGHVDPGFKGPLTICAINLSTKEETLWIGRKIFTLVITELNDVVQKEFQFKNKPEVDRKTHELLFWNQKFKDFSNSMFDLVLNNDSNEFAEKVYKQIQAKKAEKFLSNTWAITGIIITVVLAIFVYASDLFGFYEREPEIKIDYLIEQNQELQEKYDLLLKKINRVEGANTLNTEILNLPGHDSDSIEGGLNN